MLPSIFEYTFLPGEPWPLNSHVVIHEVGTRCLAGVLERRGQRSWVVQGHEYLRFKTWEAAAWALRDYYLPTYKRHELTRLQQENDAMVSVVSRWHPRSHRPEDRPRALLKAIIMRTKRALALDARRYA